MMLIDTDTGSRLQGEIEKVSKEELNQLQKENRFGFDWIEELEKELYKISVVGNEEVIGLMAISDVQEELRIHIDLLESSLENQGKNKRIKNIPGCLIAFACRLAFKKGYGGFVSLLPKTDLIKYYQETYGFRQAGRMLAVDFEDSQQIISKYLGDEKV